MAIADTMKAKVPRKHRLSAINLELEAHQQRANQWLQSGTHLCGFGGLAKTQSGHPCHS
jgi:hypothetical protein